MSDSRAYNAARPVLTVDVLIPDAQGRLLMIRRGHPPYEGMWCWPGGIVDPGETVEAAAVREVREETGLEVKIGGVLGIYSGIGRDPRGHYISIALTALPVKEEPRITEEATALKWAGPKEKVEMAFDHARIRADHERSIKGNAATILA